MKSRTKVTLIKSPIAQYEWDFSTCPDDQLALCWGYEYSREVPWLIKEYDAAKKVNPRMVDPGGRDWWYPIRPDRSEPDCAYLEAWLPMGFPKTPFLDLADAFRIAPESLTVSSTFSTEAIGIDWRTVFRPRTEKYLHSPFCYPLYIDWSKPDTVIIKAFSEEITKLRPPEKAPSELRGKSAERTILKELKALGAYRLLKRMGPSEALAYTAKCKRGHSLYQSAAKFLKAEQTAQAVLQRTFTKFG